MKNHWLIIFVLVSFVCSTSAFAGGAINKNTFVSTMGSTTVNAAIVPGAAWTNSAGMASLERGLHLDLSALYLWTKTYNNRFADSTQDSKDHKSTVTDIIPNVNAVATWRNFAIFGGVNFPVGGGHVEYDEDEESGNLLSYKLGTVTAARLSGMMPGSFFNLKRHVVEAEHVGMSVFGGVAYRWNWFSLAAGIRHIEADLEFKGSALIEDVTRQFPSFNPKIDVSANANGIGWFTGFNLYPFKNLTFATRFESPVKLKYEWDVDQDDLGLLASQGVIDGKKVRDDLPATLAFGLEWMATPKWIFGVDYNLYLNKWSQLGGTTLRDNLEDDIDNSWEIGASITYKPTPRWAFSLGSIYSDMGVDPEHSGTFLPDLDAVTFAGTVSWNPWRTLIVSLTAGHVHYLSDGYTDTELDNPALGPYSQAIDVDFEKEITYGGLQLVYRF